MASMTSRVASGCAHTVEPSEFGTGQGKRKSVGVIGENGESTWWPPRIERGNKVPEELDDEDVAAEGLMPSIMDIAMEKCGKERPVWHIE